MTGRSVRSNSSSCGKQRYRFGGLVVQKGVFCGICLHWFHYSCAGTTERYVNNIPREEHFVCPTCRNQPSGLTQAMSDLTLRPDTTKEDTNPWTYRDLPPYQHINDGNLKTTRGMNLPHDELVECFHSIGKLRQNLFALPTGNAGNQFVAELVRLLHTFNSNVPGAKSALFAFAVIPQLLLQKPAKQSKSRDHLEVLQRRINSWHDGDLCILLKEVREIQQRFDIDINRATGPNKIDAKRYSSLILNGKNSTATNMLETNSKPLKITTEVLDAL